jgi:tryptophanyl-tRNA synthetase
MMTDDEKILFGKKAYTMTEMNTFVRANARDILAVGFDPQKTFLFSDFEFMGGAFYRNVVKVSSCITLNASKAVFGFDDRYVAVMRFSKFPT